MELLSSPISASLVPLVSQLKLTLMRLLLSGTELLRSSSARNNTLLLWISGLLEQLWQKWPNEELCSRETQKLIRSSKSSKSKELLMKIIGQLLLSCQTSKRPSPNGRECLWPSTLRIWTSSGLICLEAWLLWSLIRESHAGWPCNTPTSTI